VNFDILQRLARGAGFSVAFYGLESEFLIANGYPTAKDMGSTDETRQEYVADVLDQPKFRAIVLTKNVDVSFEQ
jgi:SAM-dependent MidA family methyltransferase